MFLACDAYVAHHRHEENHLEALLMQIQCVSPEDLKLALYSQTYKSCLSSDLICMKAFCYMS